ncbi:MAG: beta-galactosidase, partial [Pseudomonadota bacterium]
MKRTLGVCYYPEHWPEDQWAEDAARMVETGLTWVRIGEFGWSRMEPSPGTFTWDWLDRAIDVLGNAGLKIILGTPTATPPRWMLDKCPDMLAVDAQGHPRKFGSRRHYDFSHLGYREECRRIARLMGERYGKNPHIAAWQIDNEYDCHDTTLSYSDAARKGFQDWLAQKYQSTGALNRAWGNVFWSMEYDTFDQIDLPNLTVTEPNPSHVLAFRRYSSDQVVAFNKVQADELRKHTDAALIHNYMGRITSFDHWKVGADLDIASWDSYPIGFLSDRLEGTPEEKRKFLRQGHPDMQAFHHDLYRAVGKGRLWVMEQQPGPVNWAPYNPAPLPGMARLWAWEAFAHGAETVCYFRWRQAPFAQEQMHAGLLRPDSAPAPALAEARQVADEIAAMPEVGTAQAEAALIFDYESAWGWDAQPQGADFEMFRLAFATYRTLRRAGLNIDILPPDVSDLSPYKLVLAPGIMTLSDPLRAALAGFDGIALIGPRADTKTDELSIPVPMGPNLPDTDVTIALTESMPPDDAIPLADGGRFLHWFEHLVGRANVHMHTINGQPAIMGGDHI